MRTAGAQTAEPDDVRSALSSGVTTDCLGVEEADEAGATLEAHGGYWSEMTAAASTFAPRVATVVEN